MTSVERVEEVMASLNGFNDTHDVCLDESLKIGENKAGETGEAGEAGEVVTPGIQADNETRDETELLYYK